MIKTNIQGVICVYKLGACRREHGNGAGFVVVQVREYTTPVGISKAVNLFLV